MDIPIQNFGRVINHNLSIVFESLGKLMDEIMPAL